jgi:hypothetical protein
MTTPSDESAPAFEEPDLPGWLLSCLDQRRSERLEELEVGDEDPTDGVIPAATALSKYAYQMLLTGEIPAGVEEALATYLPGSSVEAKATDLLKRNVLFMHLEFDVVYDSVFRLTGVSQRLGSAVLAYHIVRLAAAPITATKYLERLVTLYLAGYPDEMIFVCGAVLEAALNGRFPDELLDQAGGKRKWFGDTHGYSFAARMKYAEKTFAFTVDQQKLIWEIVNHRNNFAHTQPDIGPPPHEALIKTALALSIIVPREGV